MLRTSTRNLLLATCFVAAPSLALAQSPAQQRQNEAPPAQAQQAQPQQNQQLQAQPQQNQQMQQQQAAQRGVQMQQRQFLAAPQHGQIRAADMRDANIYTADNQSVGDIQDLLLDSRGNVVAVIVGVGGFLGIGQKDVAIPFEALDLGIPAGAVAADTTSGAVATDRDRLTTGAVPDNRGAVTDQDRQRTTAQRAEDMGQQQANQQQMNQQRQTTTTTQRTAQATSGPFKPERIVLKGVTKADLESAPEFRWDETARRGGTNTTNAPRR